MSVQDLPAVNAALNALAFVLLLAGGRLIAQGKREAHRKVMLSAFAVSSVFLTCYLIYHYNVGSVPYRKQDWTRPVYLTILLTHVLLAAGVAVMAPLTLFRGLSGRFDKHRKIAKITYPIWLYVSVTGVIIYLMLHAGGGKVEAAVRPPNIVLIISDDHGWRDYGFMKHPQARTPHIDKLAGEGLLYTRGYVTASLCRPSLASIMTGLYPHQHGITGNDPPGDAKNALSRAAMVEIFKKSKTIVGELSGAGYVSHQSGKWWEGECTCCGFTACMSHGDVTRGGRHGDVGLKIGRESMKPVIDFIDAAGSKPFLLWYAPMMPHTPHNPPERLLAHYTGLPPAQAKYLAMVEWFDETVGELADYIDRKGMAENTLFLYLADNGWVQLEGQRPLFDTRAKLSPYDAGLRTPMFLRWKGHIRPRRDDTTLVSSIDVAPTLLRAAGVHVPAAWKGIDLRETAKLRSRGQVFGSLAVHTSVDIARPEANLKYRWTAKGNWKLIAPYVPNLDSPIWEGQPAKAWGRSVELHDLAADPGETKNIAEQNPSIVNGLLRDLDAWWKPEKANP